MPRCRSFLPDLMTLRAVMVRAAMEKKNKSDVLVQVEVLDDEVFFWLGAAWVKSRAEHPSVSEVN